MKNSKPQMPDRFEKVKRYLQKFHIPAKISFFVVGILSTIWFLIRVIPKPSRATYPCMQAAAPFMSSFVIYILGLGGSVLAFRKSKQLLKKARYVSAFALILVAIISVSVFIINDARESLANKTFEVQEFNQPANQPMGTPQGINPGRVVWVWDADATNKNCQNTEEDPYYDAANNDQAVIDDMVDDALINLTGESTVADAWTALFTDFNDKKDRGAVEYQTGETIFIKINQGTASWLSDDTDFSRDFSGWKSGYDPVAETSPQVVLSILRQLVNDYGVPQDKIYVSDPIAHLFKHMYDYLHDEFPNVHYMDIDNRPDLGREQLTVSDDPAIYWSDGGDVMTSAVQDRLYSEMETADYLINMAALKAHARAGITLCAKNHFGSHTRDGAGHLHPSLIAPENDVPINTNYGYYRVFVDIMGHEKLGGNTVLFFVDGLWGGTEAVEAPVKWQMEPFNDDWPNSVFVSQDQVALESVCFDFLRTEFDEPAEPGKARPLMGAVDDYLHQAADKSNRNDRVYDPDGNGELGSLGVHEHWNNATYKSYSGNMGGDGIELIGIPDGIAGSKDIQASSYNIRQNYPNPFKNNTIIPYSLENRSQVAISVYDMQGRKVSTLLNNSRPAGNYEVQWNGCDESGTRLPTGIYIAEMKITSNNKSHTKTIRMQLQ